MPTGVSVVNHVVVLVVLPPRFKPIVLPEVNHVVVFIVLVPQLNP